MSHGKFSYCTPVFFTGRYTLAADQCKFMENTFTLIGQEMINEGKHTIPDRCSFLAGLKSLDYIHEFDIF